MSGREGAQGHRRHKGPASQEGLRVARRRAGIAGGRDTLEHDPEKACPALDAGWVPVFPRDKREAFARRSCSNKKIERDNDSKKSHPALAVVPAERREPHTIGVVFVGGCLGLIALTGLLPGELSRKERRRPTYWD